MKINIVTVKTGWILQKIAERIAEAGGEEFEVSHEPRDDVDANYYVDIGNCFHKKSKAFDIGYFTHLHEDSIAWIPPQCKHLDFIVHKCTRYLNKFKEVGFNSERMALLYPAEITEPFKKYGLKRPTILICQRGEHEGKGFHFMKEVAKLPAAKKFKWMFVGKGWREVNQLMIEHQVDTGFPLENEIYRSYPEYYSKADYLLIPSKWEGGPMSVIEAKSMGLPIIAADVGWCGCDFQIEYLFNPGDVKKLGEILEEILWPMYDRRKEVEFLSYRIYAEKLKEIVSKLKDYCL